MSSFGSFAAILSTSSRQGSFFEAFASSREALNTSDWWPHTVQASVIVVSECSAPARICDAFLRRSFTPALSMLNPIWHDATSVGKPLAFASQTVSGLAWHRFFRCPSAVIPDVK